MAKQDKKAAEHELNLFNQQLRANPAYQTMLRGMGVDPTKPMNMSSNQRKQAAGWVRSHVGDIGKLEIDQAGNVNQSEGFMKELKRWGPMVAQIGIAIGTGGLSIPAQVMIGAASGAGMGAATGGKKGALFGAATGAAAPLAVSGIGSLAGRGAGTLTNTAQAGTARGTELLRAAMGGPQTSAMASQGVSAGLGTSAAGLGALAGGVLPSSTIPAASAAITSGAAAPAAIGSGAASSAAGGSMGWADILANPDTWSTAGRLFSGEADAQADNRGAEIEALLAQALMDLQQRSGTERGFNERSANARDEQGDAFRRVQQSDYIANRNPQTPRISKYSRPIEGPTPEMRAAARELLGGSQTRLTNSIGEFDNIARTRAEADAAGRTLTGAPPPTDYVGGANQRTSPSAWERALGYTGAGLDAYGTIRGRGRR